MSSVLSRPPASLADVCQWDIGTWSQAFDLWSAHVRSGLRCLEVGAGAGGVSLWLAQRGCDVTCSDFGRPWRAPELHRRYGIRVAYEDIDVLAIPHVQTFDVVAFKSVLGALGTEDRQRRALEQIHSAIRPGGCLLFAENLAASPLHSAARRVLRRRGDGWRYVSLDELRRFLAPFSSVEVHTAGVSSVKALDHALQLICPPAWRYMAFGVARR
jgi:SAM-dependent methyltransferase